MNKVDGVCLRESSCNLFENVRDARCWLRAIRSNDFAERGAVGAIAHPLFTDYVVAFELTGILLLVAIVGALALAKRRV